MSEITNDIIDWVEQQQYWQKFLANMILSKKEITQDIINEAYSLFLKENKLINQKIFEVEINFDKYKVNTNTQNKGIWKSLSSVTGVNAIKSSNPLEISPHLTLVFGRNGSGKSGYSRLFNNSFKSNGEKIILPNIFNSQTHSPNAQFTFSSNGNEIVLDFPRDRDNPFFSQVSVFDTLSAQNQLNKENEYNFLPSDFQFFDNFIFCVEQVKQMYQNQISKMRVKNDFVYSFTNDTETSKLIKSVGEKTDLEILKQKIALSSEDDIEQKEKAKRKVELLSLNIVNRKAEYNQQLEDLQEIQKRIEKLEDFFSKEYQENIQDALNDYNKYEMIAESEGISQFQAYNIKRVSSIEWKDFLLSAKKYYDSLESSLEVCAFCQQDITGVDVIDKYWKYLKSSAEKNFTESENSIEIQIQDIKREDSIIIAENSVSESWLKNDYLSFYTQIKNFESIIQNLKKELLKSLDSKTSISTTTPIFFNKEVFTQIVEEINDKILYLNSEKVEKEVLDLDNYQKNYDDKLRAQQLFKQIENYIKNSKWVELTKSKTISTRAVTRFQNTLFSKYVSEKYITSFNSECHQLNADFSVDVIPRGSKGRSLKRLSLKNRKPSEILSEGEQRALALAAFMSEIKMDENNNSVIFDDPVSSLDIERTEIIANRLVEESRNRQVVVLTHDLVFLVKVQKACEELNAEYTVNTITKIEGDAGIVQAGYIPMDGTPVKKRVSKLRDDLVRVTKIHKSLIDNPDNIDLYEREIKSWLSRLRDTWERVIEEILFNGSVQRFSPAIQTQRLGKAPFTKDLYDKVNKAMTECSKRVHDSAAALGAQSSTPEDLNILLSDCDEFIKENRA